MSEWQPIATAPKGGKWILLYWPAILDIPFTGYCVEGEWYGLDGCRWPSSDDPTHWMDLPQPPRTDEPNRGAETT